MPAESSSDTTTSNTSASSSNVPPLAPMSSAASPPSMQTNVLIGAWHSVLRAWKLSTLRDAVMVRTSKLSNGQHIGVEELADILHHCIAIDPPHAIELATQVDRIYGKACAVNTNATTSGVPSAHGTVQLPATLTTDTPLGEQDSGTTTAQQLNSNSSQGAMSSATPNQLERTPVYHPLAPVGGSQADITPNIDGEQLQPQERAIDFAAFFHSERQSLKISVELLMSKLLIASQQGTGSLNTTRKPSTVSDVHVAAESLIFNSMQAANMLSSTTLPSTTTRSNAAVDLDASSQLDTYTLSLLVESFLGRVTNFAERRAFSLAMMSPSSNHHNGNGGADPAKRRDSSAEHGQNASSGSKVWQPVGTEHVEATTGIRSKSSNEPLTAVEATTIGSQVVDFIANAFNVATNDLLAARVESAIGDGTDPDEIASNSILTPPFDDRTGTPNSQMDEFESLTYPNSTMPPRPRSESSGRQASVSQKESSTTTGTNAFTVGSGGLASSGFALNSSQFGGGMSYPGFASCRRERCNPNAPIMLYPLEIDETISEGHRRFKIAETALLNSQLGACWDDAVGYFDRAATMLTFDDHHMLAGHAYIRCADCRQHLHDPNAMCNYLVLAAKSYVKVSITEAIVALRVAIDFYREAGRMNKVAKLIKLSADYEAMGGRFEDAFASYLEAAAMYRDILDMKGDAITVLKKAVNLSIEELNDLVRAIETLEALFEISQPTHQPQVLCRAVMCRLVCVPPEYSTQFFEAMEDVKKCLDHYTDVCPHMLHTPEHALLVALQECTAAMDVERADELVARYLAGHEDKMEDWYVSILNQIHANVLIKKEGASNMFKLEGSSAVLSASTINGISASSPPPPL